MLCTNNTSTEDNLVFLLAKQQRACGPDLYKSYLEHFSDVSVQGLYKTLRVMRKKGLIVKNGRQYSLHLQWVLSMVQFIEEFFDSGFKTLGAAPKAKTRKNAYQQWKFSTIDELFHIYAHMFMTTVSMAPSEPIVEYNPHYWYPFVYGAPWDTFLKKVKKQTGHIYRIVGAQTAADKQTFLKIKNREKETTYLCAVDERITKLRNTYICGIGAYIVRIVLDQSIADKIEELYEQDALTHGEILKLKKMKGENHISIRKNPDKVRILKKKFTQFFGPIR